MGDLTDRQHDATPAGDTTEAVVVATGHQVSRRRVYHEPRDGLPLRTACRRLEHDGQRLPRSLAEDNRLKPCSDCFDG